MCAKNVSNILTKFETENVSLIQMRGFLKATVEDHCTSELNIPAWFSYLVCPFATAIFSSLAFAVKSSFKGLKEIITGVFLAAANFADEFSISIDSTPNVAPRSTQIHLRK